MVQEELAAVVVVILMDPETDLPQVRLTVGTGGRGSRFLHRGQNQTDQRGNNGNDHQQFDQRETATQTTRLHGGHLSGKNRGEQYYESQRCVTTPDAIVKPVMLSEES